MSTAADAIDAVLAQAGAAVVHVTLEEKDVQSLGSAVAEDVAAEVAAAIVGGEASPGTGEWATFLTATDVSGTVLATGRVPGRQAMACLPRALQIARAKGAAVHIRTPERSRSFFGRSVLGAEHEPARAEPALLDALRGGGWTVMVEPASVTLMRGRVGRNLGVAFLVFLLVTLFAPLTMVVVIAALFGGSAKLRSLWAQFLEPFRRIDERLRIEIRSGALRWAIWRDGAVTLDRTLTGGELLAVHADGPFDASVILVEPTATSALPCLARGEPTQSFRPPQSDALADLIIRWWAKPPPSTYR